MDNKLKTKSKILIITIGLIIGIISYWFISYDDIQIKGNFIFLSAILGSFIGSFILNFILKVKPNKIPKFISLGVSIAILIRIIYDTTFWDKTSHNLAPFEIIYFIIISLPSAFAGSYLPELIKYLKRK